MNRPMTFALAALLGMATTAFADATDLVISQPRILPPEAGAATAVGVLEIHNNGRETEQLTEVRGEGVTLFHNVEVGGEMRMVPVDRLAIPRSSTLSFSPEALHLVFETGDALLDGDQVQTTFVFENAGERDVVFVVTTEDTLKD